MDVEALVKKALEGEEMKGERFVSPSTLSKLCLKACALELLGVPKPEPSPKRRMFMEAGIEAHKRVERRLRKLAPMREVFFEVREYKVRGYADALIYVPGGGFYALEIKTTGSFDFERMRYQGPRHDHRMQLLSYIWGIELYYGIELKGGVILYENRDTFEHLVFSQEKEMGELYPFLEELKTLSPSPDSLPPGLPKEHQYCKYCPYFEICDEEIELLPEKGKWQAKAAVRRIAKGGGKRRKGLLELASSLGWENEGPEIRPSS